MLVSGLPPDHLCWTILWHIRAKGKSHLLWQELQPAHLHVLYSLHSGRPSTRRSERAIQTQNHPYNISRLPLHQDAHQCYSQGGGGCLVQTGFLVRCSVVELGESTITAVFGPPDHPCPHGSGHWGHAEEDSRTCLCHNPGPCRLQDAADGATGLCGHHSQPGACLDCWYTPIIIEY